MKTLPLLVALAAAECTTQPAPKPSPAPTSSTGPVPDPNAPPPPAPPDCGAACMHLLALGCDSAQPTDAGASCVEVCQNINASGAIVYPVDCVRSALSCAAADACFR